MDSRFELGAQPDNAPPGFGDLAELDSYPIADDGSDQVTGVRSREIP